MQTVAERIKTVRESLGMTQEELALKMGYRGKSSVCKLENSRDNVSMKKVVAAAKALNVSPSYLMGWLDVPKQTALEDAELLHTYHRLTPENKRAVVAMMNALLD